MAGSSDYIGGLTTLQSSYSQSRAMRAQGEYQEAIANLNADQMDLEAAEAEKRGGTAAAKRRKEVSAVESEQRAALAAAGVDVNGPQAENIAAETTAIGAADIAAIEMNAIREAWGYKSQAEDTRSKGRMAKNANFFAARQTMITGGLTATGQFAKGVEKSVAPRGGG